MTYLGLFDVDKETKGFTDYVIVCHPNTAATVNAQLERLGRLGRCRVVPDLSMPIGRIQFFESSTLYVALAF